MTFWELIIGIYSKSYFRGGEHVQVSFIDYNTGKRRCDGIAYLYNGLWYWQDFDPEYGEPICVEITAWRPLGEPYMEEQKESDAA